jgi:ABC-2 type transport system permease protein
MRTAWLVMCKDLRLRLRSPLALIVYLLFPFVFSGLIALAFGGADRAPRFRLALVDQDDGFVGGMVLGAFGQEQVSRYFTTTKVSLAEAMRLIEKKKISGAIVIPEGFSQAVYDRRPTHLRVIKNPAEAIGPLAVEEAAEMVARLIDGAATVFAEPLQMIAERAGEDGDGASPDARALWPDGEVSEIAVTVNRCMAPVRRFALPPVIRLAPEGAVATADTARRAAGEAGDPATRFNIIFRLVLPGMATFALLILALGFMADIPRERRQGTLARQLAAPVRPQGILAGKMLSTVVLGLLVAMVMAVIGASLLGARANLPAFALLCLALLCAGTGMLALLLGIARTERQGDTLASIVLMVMSLIGGSWIPLSSMPAFMAQIAPATLNYWAIRGFQQLIAEGAGLAAIAVPLVVLGAIGVVGLVVGGWVLQRRMMQGA